MVGLEAVQMFVCSVDNGTALLYASDVKLPAGRWLIEKRRDWRAVTRDASGHLRYPRFSAAGFPRLAARRPAGRWSRCKVDMPKEVLARHLAKIINGSSNETEARS